jgi:hypothetical protein
MLEGEITGQEHVLSGDGQNFAHQASGGTDGGDGVGQAQPSRTHVKYFLQDLAVGDGIDQSLAGRLEERAARRPVGSFAPDRMEKDIRIKEEA